MTTPDYQVFARRFRPTTFAEVIGQETTATTLANAVRRGRVAQAYLFAGPRGVGKTSLARILAKALNCATGPTVTPCGECDNCRTIAVGNDTDVLEIDGASNRSIDDVRELRERVRFAPGHSPYKVYIIDEVHMLTTEAFNALLKTLEEPPERVVFIFATTRLDKVPPTIVSRCQRFIFRRIPAAAIEAKLESIARVEGLRLEPGAAALLARRAAGSMRDGESLLDQVTAFGGETISRADVERALGLVAGEAVASLLAAVLAGDGAAALRAIDALAADGADLSQTTAQAVEYLRDLIVLAAAPEAPGLVDLGGAELEERRAQAAAHSPAVLMNLINCFVEAAGPMARVFSPRFALEYAALKAARLRHLLPIEDLLAAAGEAEPAVMPPAAPTPAGPHAEGTAGPPPPAAAAPSQSLTDIWKKILEGLAKTDRSLYAQVSHARPISYGDGVLHLGFPPAYRASAAKLNQPDFAASFGNAVGKILGETVRVTAEVEKEAAAAAAGDSPLFDPAPDVTLVRERFRGEVVDEHPVSPPEED